MPLGFESRLYFIPGSVQAGTGSFSASSSALLAHSFPSVDRMHLYLHNAVGRPSPLLEAQVERALGYLNDKEPQKQEVPGVLEPQGNSGEGSGGGTCRRKNWESETNKLFTSPGSVFPSVKWESWTGVQFAVFKF